MKDKNWNDWKWQMKNSIKTLDELKKYMEITVDEENAILLSENIYKWQITPYYLSLIDKSNINCPIRKQAIPSIDEFNHQLGSEVDPVADKDFLVTNRIIHKYKDKIVILVSNTCPVYCRHCTRKYHTTAYDSSYYRKEEIKSWEKEFEYIKKHKEIRDVLLTGGDPLVFSDNKIKYILENIRKITHVEIIRIGSRFPVLLPQRITPNLCKILKKNKPIWFNTQFNHINEITEESINACSLILNSGIPIGNQSVLLKGINDNYDSIKNLCLKLVSIGVRPYYLYFCDNVKGVSHFQTKVSVGKEIIRKMIGTTGFAIPQFVITTKDGKILINDDNIVSINLEKCELYLKNSKNSTTKVYLTRLNNDK